MIFLVSRSQDFALVDKNDLERFENYCLRDVTDADLCQDRYRNRFLDLVDFFDR